MKSTDDTFCKQFCTPALGWTKSGRALCRKETACEEYTRHAEQTKSKHDAVNHPKHYTKHPSGIECIEVSRCLTFPLGNTVKYIWRAGDKDDLVQDLSKALWYLNDMRKHLNTVIERSKEMAKTDIVVFSHMLRLLEFDSSRISVHLPGKLGSVFSLIWRAEDCDNNLDGYVQSLALLNEAAENLEKHISDVKPK